MCIRDRYQVVIVPVAAHKPGVLAKAEELSARLSKFVRVKLDDSENSPASSVPSRVQPAARACPPPPRRAQAADEFTYADIQFLEVLE